MSGIYHISCPKHPKTKQFVRQKLFDRLFCFRNLETRIESLPDELEREHAFEMFAKAYFATQRIEAAKNIWPDKKVPPSLQEKLKLSSRDVAANGVIEPFNGKYRGYQVKFRTGRARSLMPNASRAS